MDQEVAVEARPIDISSEDSWSPEGLASRESYEESVRSWVKMYTAGAKKPEEKLPT